MRLIKESEEYYYYRDIGIFAHLFECEGKWILEIKRGRKKFKKRFTQKSVALFTSNKLLRLSERRNRNRRSAA